jgi:hypothetical protein
MKIEIQFPRNNNSYKDARLLCLPIILAVICCGTVTVNLHIQKSRELLFPSFSRNMTYANITAHCFIPFDECRCSILSHKLNTSTKCITDVTAMTGHILPLISYALQLHIISKFFSLKGIHSHILTDVFWVIALFAFIVAAIGVHGSSCLHSATDAIILTAGVLLCIFVIMLMHLRHSQNSSHETDNICRHQRVVMTKNDCEIVITVNLSSLSYYLAPLLFLVLYIMSFSLNFILYELLDLIFSNHTSRKD